MKAVVLAAGKGERFGPLAETIPKPMAIIAHKPILEHVIIHLRASGIRDIIINLHHCPGVIRDYFGDGRRWDVSIRYSYEPELLGTAGAVRNVAGELHGTFLVYYGDNLCCCDLEALRKFHMMKGGLATIVIAESYDDLTGGVVEKDQDGLAVRFCEKPPSVSGGRRWESAGIYLLEKGILDSIPADRPTDFGTDIFPRVIAEGGRIYCYEAEGMVRGVDTPERYRRVKAEMEKRGLRQR